MHYRTSSETYRSLPKHELLQRFENLEFLVKGYMMQLDKIRDPATVANTIASLEKDILALAEEMEEIITAIKSKGG